MPSPTEVLGLAVGVCLLFWGGRRFGPKSLRSQTVMIADYENGGYEAVVIPAIPDTPDQLLAAIDR